jgi:predicted O-methyltransferase YrrM
MTLDELLAELEAFGKENDEVQTERPKRMLNITRDTGQFLAVLVKATASRRLLEIGTSNGYSTLWLAWAAQEVGGHVTTVERSEFKVSLARSNFERSGLRHLITQVRDEAGKVLASAAESSVDFIFLDSDRSEYLGWWPHLKRVLRPGGLLVADNATSHPQEIASFVALVDGDVDFTTSLAPVGNGEYLAVKSPR